MKMRPEDRQRWTDALRSGEFVQGFECLRQEAAPGHDRYCCLGVYAEVSGIPSSLITFLSGRRAYKYVFPSSTDPSGETEELAAIPPFWGRLHGISEDDVRHLIRMNDVEDWSFDQIAEWIDTNL